MIVLWKILLVVWAQKKAAPGQREGFSKRCSLCPQAVEGWDSEESKDQILADLAGPAEDGQSQEDYGEPLKYFIIRCNITQLTH